MDSGRVGIVAAAAALAALAGCGSPARPPHAHVVVITIDTLRADHVSGYGYARRTTPALDRLMTEGAAFEAASTPTPTTAPAHASLFTGAYPGMHGIVKNGVPLPAAAPPTLAETLRARGYRTAAVVSAYPLARRFGLDRGFEHYDDAFSPAEASIHAGEWEGMRLDEAFDRRADATTERALAWLDGVRPDVPALFWVHYYDVHGPYDPPPSYAAAFRPPSGRGRLARQVAAYDAEARFVDDNVARLIERIDARFGAANVVLVVATDHGEGLMDHGWMEHGVHLHEELVRVALVFRRPGAIPAGRRLRVPVSLVDVSPTVLALLGWSGEVAVPDGRDLSPLLREVPADFAARPLFFQRRPYAAAEVEDRPVAGPMWAVRDGQWKYVEAPAQGVRQLFDLSADPGETRDLLASQGETADRLAALLHRWRGTVPDVPVPAAIRADDAARLRALGYVE